MAENKNDTLSTEPYKGVRDFYPEDKAIQNYIFDVWHQTARSFGFEEYDASVLEPAALYSAKTSEEMVAEQTYTFTDRGDRQVTLRPEMTPSVARMIAKKHKELSFPVRWYSIPNLYRYERMQRGRLREHWQLNCDIFGSDHFSADVEIIALVHAIFRNFGASDDMFEIRINDRAWMNSLLSDFGLDEEQSKSMFALLDRKDKIDNFDEEARKIAGKHFSLDIGEPPANSNLSQVLAALKELNIENVLFSPSTVRGLTYYTGTVFEVFDTAEENTRALLGGGRYDNLTELFERDKIPGVGFGFGDVTMKDFLETHDLLTSSITSPDVLIIPTDDTYNVAGQKLAQSFRNAGFSAAVDISTKKVGKKLSSAIDAYVTFALVLGEDEIKNETYVLKNLAESSELSGTLDKLIERISS